MRQLTEEEFSVWSELTARISKYRQRNQQRSRYADADGELRSMGVSIPPGMENFRLVVGWPQKACDVLSARMRTDFFSSPDNALMYEIEGVYSEAGVEFVELQAIDSALEHGPAFVFTSRGEAGEPEVVSTVRSALSASAILNPRTGAPTAALEVIDDKTHLLSLPYRVLTIENRDRSWQVVEESPTSSSRVRCAVYVHGKSVRRPFGRSRISKPLMGYTDAAVRTMLRQEVSAEFFSAPRQALLGGDESMFTDKHGNVRTGWSAIISGVWAIPDAEAENGERVRPEFKQFPQISMQPFSDQLRMIAQMASGETSIPLSYLGIAQDSNPQSAQAIEANEIDLVEVAEREKLSLNSGRKQLIADIADVMYGDVPRGVHRAQPMYVSSKTRSLTEMSQFVQLQVQAGNMRAGARSTLSLLPLDRAKIDEIVADNARQSSIDRVTKIRERSAGTADPAQVSETVNKRVADE